MNGSDLPDIANLLWMAVAAGGIERVGAYGTETTVAAVKSLWTRLREHRRRKNLPETPASQDELREDLISLLIEDPQAASLVQQITLSRAETSQTVNTTFHGQVTINDGNIGITN